MKSASSSLNPYAASYIPLSKSGEDPGTNSFEKEWLLKDLQSPEVPMSETEAPFRSYATVASASKSRHSADLTDKRSLDEEFQMNLEYLQMMFPGLSYQSLAAVHLESKEDMEASIEMLSQLESYIDEPLEYLPETFGIGDTTGGLAGLKLKDIKDELVVASSSGNSYPIG